MATYYRKLSQGIRWFYKFDMNGKTYRSQCIYHSKKECAQAERDRYNELDEERRFGKQDKPIPLSTAIADRLKFLEVKYSLSHKKDSEYYLNLFTNFVGELDIREVNRKSIEDFLLDYSDQLLKREKDNYQVNAALKTIKSLFNYTITRNDLMIKNPCQTIKPFPIKKSLKYIPTEEEIELVRANLNKRQLLLFDFVMETGSRINEALNLTFDDLKTDYIILYTRKSKNSDKIPRKVPFPACLLGIKGKGRVFPEWNDTPKFLDKVLRKNKIKVWGWHSLRHRFASRLSKEGRPIFEIMSLLGHSNLSTTQKYLQLLP